MTYEWVLADTLPTGIRVYRCLNPPGGWSVSAIVRLRYRNVHVYGTLYTPAGDIDRRYNTGGSADQCWDDLVDEVTTPPEVRECIRVLLADVKTT